MLCFSVGGEREREREREREMADQKSMAPLQVDFPVFASGWSQSARSVVLGGGGGPGNSGVKNKLVRRV